MDVQPILDAIKAAIAPFDDGRVSINPPVAMKGARGSIVIRFEITVRPEK